jgi:phosphatidate cytidylyltransferase
MLRKRIITAAILIPIVLVVLFYATPQQFCIATGLVSLVAAGEWVNLMQLKEISTRFIYLLIVATVFFGALFVPTPLIFSIAFIWWTAAFIAICVYPRGVTWWVQYPVVRGGMGILVLLPCWAALNYIRNQETGGITALLFLFVLIWGADTVAYFVGKKWGTSKLAPLVSPGKSKQGAMGALMFAVLVVVPVLFVSHTPWHIWPWVMLLALATVLFSIVGDLFESMIKRQAGVKDSSQLLPGHGGLLDRIDSLTAAAPVFALGGWLLGRYLY